MGSLRVQEIYRAFMMYKAGENTKYGDILNWIYEIVKDEVRGGDKMSNEEVAIRFQLTTLSDGLDVDGFEAYMEEFLKKAKIMLSHMDEDDVQTIINVHHRCLEIIKKCMEKK
jgi:hypothetical protein